MPARFLAAAACLTLLAAVAACQSSGRYGTPGYAAAAVGVGAVGAAASRAVGGCYAQCGHGSHCNRATGLCDPGEGTPVPLPSSASKGSSRSAPVVLGNASYEPGHEYVVPATDDADAGCAPVLRAHGDGGALVCEMDGGTT